MRQTAFSLALGIVVLGNISASAADDSPRAIIERAIKAQGGQERLEKVKADRVTLNGVMILQDKKGTFTGETTVNTPSQFRNAVELKLETKTFKFVQIFNGDKAIVTLDGQPQEVLPAALAEMSEIMFLDRATRLTPLLSDKSFTLASLGESKVKDKPVLGVKVSAEKHADLKMFFDKDTGLLVKTEHDREDGGKTVTQEEFYSEFKDIGGFKRPTKVTVFRQGKKLMEAQLVDAKALDKVDETLFTKP